jgi:hypothetical protein
MYPDPANVMTTYDFLSCQHLLVESQKQMAQLEGSLLCPTRKRPQYKEWRAGTRAMSKEMALESVVFLMGEKTKMCERQGEKLFKILSHRRCT